MALDDVVCGCCFLSLCIALLALSSKRVLQRSWVREMMGAHLQDWNSEWLDDTGALVAACLQYN